jgi:D-inositol-3-phosphate glycosyltransferase
VLIVGSGRNSTGFGRVVNELGRWVGPLYDVHVLGYDVFERVPTDGWTLHPGSRLDVFGTDQLPRLHGSLRPDLTLIINDLWFIPAFLAALQRSPHRDKVAVYLPIDGELLEPRRIGVLKSIDAVAVYTEFGRRVVVEALAAERVRQPVLPLIEVIPHGISTDIFRPMFTADTASSRHGDRAEARRALLGDDAHIGGFWILNANKNSRRKRLDLTIIGFALFARDKPPNVRLYLHAGRRDTGPDLQRLARNLQLGERLILTADTYYHPDVSPERLNMIYNACDVGVNTSIGEGWGLVSFEHAATAAAQIVPRHSASTELWQNAAVFLEPSAAVRFSGCLEGLLVSPESLASALEELYRDQANLTRMSRSAYLNATRSEWSWKAVALRWDRFFQALLAGPSGSNRVLGAGP